MISGGRGDDHLSGDGGNDILVADRGKDIVDGGEGDDVFLVTGTRDGDHVTITTGEGKDLILTGGNQSGVVTDFAKGDMIGFNGVFADEDELSAVTRFDNEDMIVTLPSGKEITFTGGDAEYDPVEGKWPGIPPVYPDEPDEPPHPDEPDEPPHPDEPDEPPRPDEPGPDRPSSDSGGGGGRFVATAAYGDFNHPDVVALRAFRDIHLVRSTAGRAFIAFYWVVGPQLARVTQPHYPHAAAARTVLSRHVRLLRRADFVGSGKRR